MSEGFSLRKERDWMNGYLNAMRAYATFTGRASRAEFWQFTLVMYAIIFAVFLMNGLISEFTQNEFVSSLKGLILLSAGLVHSVPYLAVLVRRLHDIDVTGRWAILGGVPLLGFVMLIPAAMTGTPGPNRFDTEPVSANRGRPASGRRPPRTEPSFAQQPSPEPHVDLVSQIEKLSILRESDRITADEFNSMKAKLFRREQNQ
jgi:uncharacterized membrane protein YhaH (DUF805 family)